MTDRTVSSSIIRAMDYAPMASALFVEFNNGRVYMYMNVSRWLFNEIIEAESVGKAFNARIKEHPDHYTPMRFL